MSFGEHRRLGDIEQRIDVGVSSRGARLDAGLAAHDDPAGTPTR